MRSLDQVARQRLVGFVECAYDGIFGKAQSHWDFEDGALDSPFVHVMAVADSRVVFHAHERSNVTLAWLQLGIDNCSLHELEVAPITLVAIGHGAFGPIDDDGEESPGLLCVVVGQDFLLKGWSVAFDRPRGRNKSSMLKPMLSLWSGNTRNRGLSSVISGSR